jgi:hypothetical protein
MEAWRTGPVPPAVGKAATARDLGGPVTRATATRLTRTRFRLGLAAFLATFVAFGQVVALVHPPKALATALLVVVVLGFLIAGARLAGARQTLHLFERGAVIEHREGVDLQVVGWTEMLPYERYQQWVPGRGPHHLVLTIRVAGKVVFSCADDTAGRLADVISAMELNRVRPLLAAGRPVEYGAMQITGEALRFPRLCIPWVEVTGARSERRTIRLLGAPGAVPLFRDRTPHQRTLLALSEQLSAQARYAAARQTG